MKKLNKIIDDPINHPHHYTYGKYECIDIMEDCFGKDALMTFCYLNAFKYLYRAKHKNGIQDIKKALFYITKYIKLAEMTDNT